MASFLEFHCIGISAETKFLYGLNLIEAKGRAVCGENKS